jgi:hypothetical protein
MPLVGGPPGGGGSVGRKARRAINVRIQATLENVSNEMRRDNPS